MYGTDGALGTLLATTAAYPGYPRRVEITGPEGTAILEHDRLIATDLRINNLRTQQENLISAGITDQNASSSSPVVSDVRGHQMVIHDFIRAIQEDGTPICDGIEGRRSVALIQKIYEAARS